MLLLHLIFYKVSIYYLLRHLDILNHSNKFNKNIFFITCLICMSIFSLFIFELSSLISNVIITYIWHIDICILLFLLYVIIPIEFINTIFDSNNYKEILSPEFHTHSHIKLLKKYYAKISSIYKESYGINKKIKKHFFFFRGILFLTFIWVILGGLRNMIYKKNYNYVIADDNTINFKKYLLYKSNEGKNANKIYNKTIFFFFQKKHTCFNYYFNNNMNELYFTNKKKTHPFKQFFKQIYSFFYFLCYIIIHHIILLHNFIIRELLINICALGVTTNSIVAGISSVYFIYDYIITFIYFLHIPKIQIQIYNIEERILINFTNYMFKKEELEKLQSNIDIHTKRLSYDNRRNIKNVDLNKEYDKRVVLKRLNDKVDNPERDDKIYVDEKNTYR